MKRINYQAKMLNSGLNTKLDCVSTGKMECAI